MVGTELWGLSCGHGAAGTEPWVVGGGFERWVSKGSAARLIVRALPGKVPVVGAVRMVVMVRLVPVTSVDVGGRRCRPSRVEGWFACRIV